MTGTSVVIPTYNRADLIGETLEAVLGQTLAPDEVIVVDDGSTDGTAAVLAGFGSRVRHVPIPNSGDLVARNTGLRAASSGLVAFCDSDDVWAPEFLAVMSAQWRAEPKLKVCYSNFCILRDGILSDRSKFDDAPESFWSGLRRTGPDSGAFDSPFIEKLLEFQPLFTSCMMVHRQAFMDLGGWDESVSRIVGCDFATALRVAAAPPTGIVRRVLVGIRKHGANISGDVERMNLGDARVLEHVLRTRPELAPWADDMRRSAAHRRRDALGSAFVRRDFAAVRDTFELLPPEARSWKERVKWAIASLPAPLGALAASVTGVSGLRPGAARPRQAGRG